MEITCQHCGTTAPSDRVMCPSCKRRMQPTSAAPTPAAQPPVQPEPTPWQPPGYPPPYGSPYPPPPAAGYQPYPQPPPQQPQWYPLPPQHGPWGGPLKPTVLFDRASTEKVSRLSVGFRLFLAIPAYIVLVVLNIGLLVGALAAWLAAVFTAQVPVGLYNFIGYVTGYFLRFNAYLAALTDKWPTLSADDPYPVVIRYPGPERLNRAAVFFRFILVIPAAFVSAVVSVGLYVLLIPIWLITAVAGRVPRPIFDAASGAVRYQTRFQAYLFLLTSAYPSELFASDREDPRGPIEQRPELLPPQRSAGGRRLLVTMIVAGVIGQAVQFTFESLPTIVHAFRDVIAESDLSDAYDNVDLEATAYCPQGPGQLRCLQASDTVKLNELSVFDGKVAGLDVGSSSKPYVDVLRSDTQQLIAGYQRLIEAPTLAAYRHDATLLPLAIGRFEEAENSLDDQLIGN